MPEGRKFKFKDKVYVIRGNHIAVTFLSYTSQNVETNVLCDMIAHSELIHLIPEKPTLTDKQITAIKGRIAEGTPWATRDKGDDLVCLWEYEPIRNEKYFTGALYSNTWSSLYDFITFENSPVYLPDLIEGSEGE
ncbi:MAG: hypothetical protein SOY97_06030 [Candidatus Metalachnospira sp.]|nr:hypothetical protein [Candidatus Metalachnospira sp.]